MRIIMINTAIEMSINPTDTDIPMTALREDDEDDEEDEEGDDLSLNNKVSEAQGLSVPTWPHSIPEAHWQLVPDAHLVYEFWEIEHE